MGNIIVGVLFIIGGLSGEYAIAGTQSSGGLALLGVGLIFWGLFQMKRAN